MKYQVLFKPLCGAVSFAVQLGNAVVSAVIADNIAVQPCPYGELTHALRLIVAYLEQHSAARCQQRRIFCDNPLIKAQSALPAVERDMRLGTDLRRQGRYNTAADIRRV